MKKFLLKTFLLLLTLIVGGATFSHTWASVNNGDVFARISSVSDLSDGDEIIFVNQAETHACGTTQNTNNRTPVAISVSDHSYTYASKDNVQVFVVKINNSGKYGFHTGSGYIYSASSSSNNLRTNSTLVSYAPTGAYAWTLSISSNVVSATNVSNTSYYLAFNGTDYFTQYSSGYIKPYIYKKQAATKVATPTFSPISGAKAYGTKITISCATDGATIYYTTDGSTPTSSSTEYDSEDKPTVTGSMTIKAFAIDGNGTLTDSDVASADYSVKAPATPTFTPSAGSVYYGTEVTIASDDGTTIYYTTNGDTPDNTSTEYDSENKPNITAAGTIKAIAYDAVGTASSVGSAEYTLKAPNNPTFSLDAGMVTKGATLELTTSAGASIRYTTDGTTPTSSVGTVYSSAITINSAQTIKAVAYDPAGTSSSVVSKAYTVFVGDIVTFDAKSDTGTSLSKSGVSFTTSATESDVYKFYKSSSTTFSVTDGKIKKIEFTGVSDYAISNMTASTGTLNTSSSPNGVWTGNVTSVTFTASTAQTRATKVKIYVARIAAPTFSVAAGEVAIGTTVTLTCATDDATIYYTTDGTTPTTSSNVYSCALTINKAQTIKAIAAKDGLANSEVASVSYTVRDYTNYPFSWNDKSTPTGVTNSGVGTYDSSPYLKFDGTGDNIILKINAAPGELKYDIQGNSFSGGTFKVQYSADGSSYTDLKSYTSLSSKTTETSTNIPASTRYIKWIYTTKSSGNVALGNINLTGCESVTIGSAGYTTYTTTGKVTMPSGVTAYIATAVNTNTIHMEEVKNVPATKPIVLKAIAGTYYLPIITTDPDDVSGNILLPSDGSVTGDGETIFALGYKNSTIGFYVVNDEQTVPAGKAYLIVGSGVREYLNFSFDEETGINSIENGKLTIDNYYDLSGRRVVKPTKGLYIVNGKKVFIKK